MNQNVLGILHAECAVCARSAHAITATVSNQEKDLTATLTLHSSLVPLTVDWTKPLLRYRVQRDFPADDFVHAQSQADSYARQAFRHGLSGDTASFPRLVMLRALCGHCLPIAADDPTTLGWNATSVDTDVRTLIPLIAPMGITDPQSLDAIIAQLREASTAGGQATIDRYWTTWHSARLVRTFEKRLNRR